MPRNSRSNREHGLSLDQVVEVRILERTQGNRSGFRLFARFGHELGMKTGHRRQHGFRCGHRRQTGPAAQSRHSRHRRRPRFAERSSDHQHMTKAALVGIARTWSKQWCDFLRGNELEMKRRSDRLVRRADRRYDDGPVG